MLSTPIVLKHLGIKLGSCRTAIIYNMQHFIEFVRCQIVIIRLIRVLFFCLFLTQIFI